MFDPADAIGYCIHATPILVCDYKQFTIPREEAIIKMNELLPKVDVPGYIQEHLSDLPVLDTTPLERVRLLSLCDSLEAEYTKQYIQWLFFFWDEKDD